LEEVDILPNIKSAKKRVKVGAIKQAENQVVKSVMRTSIKKVKIAVTAGDRELASNLYRNAAASIDKAAQKGVIHKNNAANKKSGLSRLINGLAS
jgi:small subunit ribosomal protein S20